MARVAHGFSEDICWNWDWDKAIRRVREIRRSTGDKGRGGEERLQQMSAVDLGVRLDRIGFGRA